MTDSALTALWRDEPGRRFVRRYERLRGNPGGVARRALRAVLAVLLIAVGIVFLPLPGPGFVPLALGAALLAGQSRGVAAWLDRAELRVRRWLRR